MVCANIVSGAFYETEEQLVAFTMFFAVRGSISVFDGFSSWDIA